MNPPPISSYHLVVANKDDGHLNLLSVFHYVIAGFHTFALLFLIGHYLLFRAIFTNEKVFENSPEGPPPEAFMDIFIWFYVLGAFIITVIAVTNFLAARYLKQKKCKFFTMIVAGINCMNIPLGTVLGVFTFIVLLRPSVMATYSEKSKFTGV